MGLGTFLVTLFVVVTGGVLAWRTLRKRRAQPAAGDAAVQRDAVGVRIVTSSSGHACSHAKQLSDKRYLAAEKPPLPLAGCPLPQQCACRYVKVLDERDHERRSGKDRRANGPRFEKDKTPRRSGKDRRRLHAQVDWDRH